MPSLERFVYLVKAGDNHYKVGIAQDVMERIKGIQTGNPIRVELVIAVWLANAQMAEARIHKWLSRFKSDGGREWFELTSEQVVFLVMKMSSLTLPDDVSRYMVVRSLIARQDKLEERMNQIEHPETKEVVAPKKPQPIVEKDAPDELLDEAAIASYQAGKASASMLQRRLRVGYARAARLLDELEKAGAIGEADGARAREVIEDSPFILRVMGMAHTGRTLPEPTPIPGWGSAPNR